MSLLVALIACDQEQMSQRPIEQMPIKQRPVNSTAGQAEAALNLITTEQLLVHITYLADDDRKGRETGATGYTDAANYVAEQFAAMGVMPGADDGWYQPVTLRQYKVDETGASMVLHHSEGDMALRYRDDFSSGGDPLRVSTSVRAEVVFVGHGVHAPEHGYSDYEGIDVRGKIIANFSGAPKVIEGPQRAYYASSTPKFQEAVARGAIGLISLRSRKSSARRSWEKLKGSIGKRPRMRWLGEDGSAARYFPEIEAIASISEDASERLFDLAPLSFEEALDANEAGRPASASLGVEVTLTQRSEHSDTASPNVIGVVRGTDPDLSAEYVVYTAHH